MKRFLKLIALSVFWLCGAFAFTFVLLALGWSSLMMLLAGTAAIGWGMYTFLYYRHCRREELLQLLSGAVADGWPITPPIRAYLNDRPQGAMKSFWIACLLSVLPFPGFYWFWHRRRSFDRRVEELANLLEQGVSLDQALRRVPATATVETRLAAAVGNSTGRLSRCLQAASRQRVSTLWIDVLPQIIYIFVVLLAVAGVAGFLTYFMMPKFQRILADFHTELPELTQSLVLGSSLLASHWQLVALAIASVSLLAAILWLSSTARWFFPVVGTVYRRDMRCRVLRSLGLMLETGRPVPQSLKELSLLPFGHTVQERLEDARLQVEQGEDLGDSLLRVGLISSRMLPMVRAAERAGHLPWALVEMADLLYQRTTRSIQRLMQILFPAAVVLLGGLVAFVVISIFLPLVAVITEMTG